MLGTLLGVVIATLVAVGLNPTGWGVVAVVAVLACGTYAVFPASFAVGVAMLTGVVVFLLHAVAPGSVQTALDRGIDTAIGGAIGLIAYALVAWTALSIGPLMAALVETQHQYPGRGITGWSVAGGCLRRSCARSRGAPASPSQTSTRPWGSHAASRRRAMPSRRRQRRPSARCAVWSGACTSCGLTPR